jgi:hypothetical protein
MRGMIQLSVIVLAAAAGAAMATLFLSDSKPADAASNDRYGDYIMATGAVAVNPRIPTDGVWLLDYKAGKLLGTVIDRNSGKIVGWAEVDLTTEFGLARQADVHFLMTTGYITQGQSALYLAETTTGQFGVYTMGPGPNGVGIVIRRHDLTRFREAVAQGGGGLPPAGSSGLPPTGSGLPPTGSGLPPTGSGLPPAVGGGGLPSAVPPAANGGAPVIPPTSGGTPAQFPTPTNLPTIPGLGSPGAGGMSPGGGKIPPGHVPPAANPLTPSPSGGITPPGSGISSSVGDPRYSGNPSPLSSGNANASWPLPSNNRGYASDPPSATPASSWPPTESHSAATTDSYKTDSYKVTSRSQPPPALSSPARMPPIPPLNPIRNDMLAHNSPAPIPGAGYPPYVYGYPPYAGPYAAPPGTMSPLDPTVLLQHFLRPLPLP